MTTLLQHALKQIQIPSWYGDPMADIKRPRSAHVARQQDVILEIVRSHPEGISTNAVTDIYEAENDSIGYVLVSCRLRTLRDQGLLKSMRVRVGGTFGDTFWFPKGELNA